MISAVSIMVVPERLKNLFPSAKKTRPLFTARSSNQSDNASRTGTSTKVLCKLKPHGATIRKSGSASQTFCHEIAAECSPLLPRSKFPFAASTSSDAQLLAGKIGSVHSKITRDGVDLC